MAKFTRRNLLKTSLGGALGIAVARRPLEAFGSSVEMLGAERRLADTTFRLLPLGDVRPSGWLYRQLRVQADGLSGHLEEFWPDVSQNSGWLGGEGESWENGPYYLDGLIPLAYLLDDHNLKVKAPKFIEWTLNHQRSDGMIGPPSDDDWWTRMIMLKALAQYHEATNDPRVLPVMSRFCHYQLNMLPSRPLSDWGKYRWQDEVLVVQWLYERTKDPLLLELCELLMKQGFDWKSSFADFQLKKPMTRDLLHMNEPGFWREDLAMRAHGVNNAQALKVAAVQFRLSGDLKEKSLYDHQIGVLNEYHGMPNGMFSCDEHLGGRNPSHGTELCSVVETMFSMEVVLAAFGDATVADRIEKIAFNALPGTFTDDMWAHQYDQQSNQVQVALNSKPWTSNSAEANLYGLAPQFPCCLANFHQGWPKYAASLWMATNDEGLVAAMYSPCEVRTKVRGTHVHVLEETEYPFRNDIRISVNPENPVLFPIHLRIPAWANSMVIRINGEETNVPFSKGSYIRIERTWVSGDDIQVSLGVRPRLSRWYNNSVALEAGSVLFSFSPGENWVKLRDRGPTADWQVYPTKQWNYALQMDEQRISVLGGAEAQGAAGEARTWHGVAGGQHVRQHPQQSWPHQSEAEEATYDALL